jgi:hypothetical protein
MHERTPFRLRWIIIVVIMIAGASVIAGCTSNTPSGGSAPAQQGTPVTTQETTRQVTQETAQDTDVPTLTLAPVVTVIRPAGGSVKAVDWNLLKPFLPAAPAGWTAADPEGTNMNEQDASWTLATRSYSGGADKQADVSIMDSAYYDVGAWTGWAGLSAATTADGYVKPGTAAGFPSWESYDKGSNTYDTWVNLNNRFMVTVTITNGSKADLDSFVNSINYAGIAALK